MKNIKGWEQFNELKRSTYHSAAKKLDALGHTKRASNIRDEIENRDSKEKYILYNQGLEKYGSFDFKSLGDEPIVIEKAAYGGLDWAMMSDTFKLDVKELEGEPAPVMFAPGFLKEDFAWFQPFWFGDNGLDGAYNDGERDEVMLYFSDRKEAMNFLRTIKEEVNNAETHLNKFAKTDEDKEINKQHAKQLKETVTKLKVQEIFRT